jgi:arabinan endo-1,5-alpha-L-arabinosidase
MKDAGRFSKAFLCALAAAVGAAVMVPQAGCSSQKKQPAAIQHVSVHDPSIIKAGDTYYLMGSHTAAAESKDLMVWKQLSRDYQKPSNEPFFGKLTETLRESFRWAGYHDGDATGYAVWAPDAVYDEAYQWPDGSKGAYLLYYCTSSTWRRSCIGYLVSKTMDGKFTYADTIVYSGFTKNGNPDGRSKRNTKWDNDYLNLKKLIAKTSKNGGIDSIEDDKCFKDDGSWNHLYAPNAIDPCVFFDKTGKKMYMVYGSWSGGLFLLEMDPATGEPIYPGVDSTDPVSGNYTDRYFGTHIAGGNHQSGEGPYIQYDSETGYYYLYESYGGLTAQGGYNMRLFRSKNVLGPYLDAAGHNAADSSSNNGRYGIKLMGNYEFSGQKGKCSAGGNSALIDSDGAHYLVYHQRFHSNPVSETHEVRIHQQFLNREGWPVTAVYEYRGEKIAHYRDGDVVGTYEFINHGTEAKSGSMLKTERITLNKDGTVTGDETGTWSKTDSGKGYDDVTLQLGKTTYSGVFFRQYDEEDSPQEKMTFTAIGNDNTSVWGSMVRVDSK